MSYARDTGKVVSMGAGDMAAKIARTVTGNSGWLDVGNARELVAQLDANAGTGTTPTLDVKFQTSFDGTDASAVDITNGAFTQVTTVASAQLKRLTDFHRFVKVVWTIAGTTPSFTFGVYASGRE